MAGGPEVPLIAGALEISPSAEEKTVDQFDLDPQLLPLMLHGPWEGSVLILAAVLRGDDNMAASILDRT
jgi:hypothetical protein